MPPERLHVLRGAAEDHRVAAFQAQHDTLAGQRLAHQQRTDFSLRRGMAAAALADINEPGCRVGMGEDLRAHQ